MPIPKPLWAAAGAVAREHGVFRTSKVLRLEFNKLKEFAERVKPRKRATTPPAQFVELMTTSAAGVSECVIEMEGRHGKMRIQWKGMTAADLAQLSRMMMERRDSDNATDEDSGRDRSRRRKKGNRFAGTAMRRETSDRPVFGLHVSVSEQAGNVDPNPCL